VLDLEIEIIGSFFFRITGKENLFVWNTLHYDEHGVSLWRGLSNFKKRQKQWRANSFDQAGEFSEKINAPPLFLTNCYSP
jgi:hypothetical protein